MRSESKALRALGFLADKAPKIFDIGLQPCSGTGQRPLRSVIDQPMGKPIRLDTRSLTPARLQRSFSDDVPDRSDFKNPTLKFRN